MGTFLGHAFPGAVFFLYGLFYIIKDALYQASNARKMARVSARLPGHLHNGDARNTGNGHIPLQEVHANGKNANNDWDSLDSEETSLFLRQTDDNFPPNSAHKLDAHIRGDALELQGEASPGQPKKPGKYEGIVSICEGMYFIIICTIGIVGVLVPQLGGNNVKNWQHATMFAYFAVYGALNIAHQTCFKSSAALASQRHLEKVVLSLALVAEGLLFYFHTHGRAELDIHVHLLLVIAIFASAIGAGLEPWLYSPATPGVRRLWVTAMCLQGSWFWQIGFILYNPFKDTTAQVPDEHEKMESMMMATVMFTWHLLAILSMTGLIHGIVRYLSWFRCFKCKSSL